MKAVLEFDLNDPDDRMAHMRCVKSLEMAIALFSITQLTYSTNTAQEYREKIITATEGINLNELIT